MIKEDNSSGGWIIGDLPGTIPNPIPQKYVKKLSKLKTTSPKTIKEIMNPYSIHNYIQLVHNMHRTGVHTHSANIVRHKINHYRSRLQHHIVKRKIKEDVSGFADASSPSNSNYAEILDPVQMAKSTSKDIGKKKMKKTVKEMYQKRMVSELMGVCPFCNNTGMVQKYGNNRLCTHCSAGEDARVEKENLMYQQAKDMLSKGMTTPVAEEFVEPYKAGTKVKVNGKIGEISHVHRSETGDHKYKITDLEANDPYKQKRLEGGNFINHDRVKPIKEENVNELSTKTLHNYMGKRFKQFMHNKNAPENGSRVHKNTLKGVEQANSKITKREKFNARNEQVITSLDDVLSILESYKPSDKLKARTKYLVQPKLSKMLQDRLAARRAAPKTSKGYTPSAGTLGLAAARRAQMSHSKKKNVDEEKKAKKLSGHIEPKLLPSLSAKPMMGSSNDNRVSEEAVNEWTHAVHVSWENEVHDKDVPKGSRFGTVHYTRSNSDEDAVAKAKYNHKYAKNFKVDKVERLKEERNRIRIPGMDRELDKKYAPSRPGVPGLREPLSVWRKNQKKKSVKEEVEFLADGKKVSDMKRKYLGKVRGRTATGKPAHPIEIDPVLKTSSEVNKVVK